MTADTMMIRPMEKTTVFTTQRETPPEAATQKNRRLHHKPEIRTKEQQNQSYEALISLRTFLQHFVCISEYRKLQECFTDCPCERATFKTISYCYS